MPRISAPVVPVSATFKALGLPNNDIKQILAEHDSKYCFLGTLTTQRIAKCETPIGYSFYYRLQCVEALTIVIHHKPVIHKGQTVARNDHLALHGDTTAKLFLSAKWLRTGSSKGNKLWLQSNNSILTSKTRLDDDPKRYFEQSQLEYNRFRSWCG
jgi:hypothetical protein